MSSSGPFSFTVVVAVLCSLLVARTLDADDGRVLPEAARPPRAAVPRHGLVPRTRAVVPRASLDHARSWRLPRSPRCLSLRAVPADGVLAGRRQRLHDFERRAAARRVARRYARQPPKRARLRLERSARGAQRLHHRRRGRRRQWLRRAAARPATCAAARWSFSSTTPTARAGPNRIFERKATEIVRSIPGARFQFRQRWRRQPAATSRWPATSPIAWISRPRTSNARSRAMPGLGMITSSAALQKPEIVIRPSPERAARARRHDRDAGSRHAHRDQRRRRHQPREVQPRQPPDSDPRAPERRVAQRPRAAAAPVRARQERARCR